MKEKTLSDKEMYSYNKETKKKEYCYKSKDVEKAVRIVKAELINLRIGEDVLRANVIINKVMGKKIVGDGK